MIISRRRFEQEIAKAREEVAEKNLAEAARVQMMHMIDRKFDDFERTMAERIKSVDANHIADDGKKVDAVQVVRCEECVYRRRCMLQQIGRASCRERV